MRGRNRGFWRRSPERRPTLTWRIWATSSLVAVAAGLVPTARAQTTQAEQAQRDQAQRQAEQRQALRSAPDVRLQPGQQIDYHLTTVPAETPCFRIEATVLEGAHSEQFGFVQKYLDAYRGQCIGQDGLRLLAHRTSDLILAHGYITSRVVIPEQNLATGKLRVVLLAGTVGAVRFAPGSAPADWQNALPIKPGDVLNLRAIEQGLEQLKRVPSQEAKIDIAPGAQPGTSDLMLSISRGKSWRLIANLDDSGSYDTGKEQGGLTLAIDQPLGINDLLSIGYTHSVGDYDHVKGTHGGNFSYSVPWRDWTFSLTSSNYTYRQSVFGSLQTFAYTGSSRSTAFSATRLLHRDARSRTSLEMTIATRHEHSYVDSVEVQTQRRKITSAELALIQRRYIGASQLDLRLAYRWGVPWMGGQWQPSVDGGPTNRYGVTVFDGSLSTPFSMLGTPWLWLSELHAQATGDRLYAEDYITLGGRYTVRGYDGNTVLGGNHGAYWRNTLNLPIGSSGVVVYGGIDAGHVGGEAPRNYGSHSLSGVVTGVRGSRWGLSWDLFAGWPLQAPRGFPVRRPTAGMQWIYTY